MKTIKPFFLFPLLLFFEFTNSQVSTELTLTGKTAGVILDMRYHPGTSKNWSIFSRNHLAYHVDEQTAGFLTFNKLAYTFKSGLGLSANLIGSTRKFYP